MSGCRAQRIAQVVMRDVVAIAAWPPGLLVVVTSYLDESKVIYYIGGLLVPFFISSFLSRLSIPFVYCCFVGDNRGPRAEMKHIFRLL